MRFSFRHVVIPCFSFNGWVLLAAALLTLARTNVNATVVINEVMASNGATIADEDGDHEDWIELFNSAEEPVDLSGWGLSDDYEAPFKWTFPAGTVIGAGAHLVVWASGKDRDAASSQETGALDYPTPFHNANDDFFWHHTNFAVGAAGEEVVLTRPDGARMDELAPTPIPRDVSYGRQPDGGQVWVYFEEPTPGAANTTQAFALPPDVRFSEPAGFRARPFHVELASLDPDAVIRYTLDGSEPGPDSPEYAVPVFVSETTILRAAVVGGGLLHQPPATRTWLFLDDILGQDSNPPEGWPGNREVNNKRMEYGMRQQVVQSDEARLREGMLAIPSISLVTDLKNLFHAEEGIYVNPRAVGRERPVSVELIDPVATGAESGFQINAGLRIRGGFSRSPNNPKHSFRVLFRSAYGERQLHFPLFGDEGADTFDKIDLRTAQNYSWAFENSGKNTFLRDVFSRDTQRDMGMPHTRSRYYHLYLNGQYWGLYQSQERGESDYASTYMGGQSDDWDVIKTSQPGYFTDLNSGTWEAWHALHEIAINEGFSGPFAENYQRVKGLRPDGTPSPELPVLLDEDNLIRFMLVAYFTGDPDSPISIWGGFPNNMYALFNRVDPTGFKWLRHDAEHSLGAHGSYGLYADTTRSGETFTEQNRFNPATLHLRLMEHPEYRMRFVDLVQKHLFGDGALAPEKARERVWRRMAEIDLAIIGESARWGRGRTRDHDWIPAVNEVLRYLEQRGAVFIGQLRDRGWFPSIAAPRFRGGDGILRISARAPFYYTRDGTDPRGEGGGVRDGAVFVDSTPSQSGPVTLVGRGSVWRYFDEGTEPPEDGGLRWLAPDHADESWAEGPAVLGFAGASVRNPVATTTNRFVSGSSNEQVTTTYFRHAFFVDSPESFDMLEFEILRDDGAVVHLNGEEVLRTNMPPGDPTYDTYASSVVGSPQQNTYFTYFVDAGGRLRQGENVLAVQVHQCNASSSDLYFDLSMTALSDAAFVEIPVRSSDHFVARAYDEAEWSAKVDTAAGETMYAGVSLHEWDFEDAAGLFEPSFSAGGGALAVELGPETEPVPNTGGDFETQHLRVNHPLGSRLIFSLPTSGYEAVTLDFLTRRSGQGAGLMTVEYTVDGLTWTDAETLTIFNAPPQARSLDFGAVPGVDDNPSFAVRFTFAQGEGGEAGNNRFDDVVVRGVPLPGTNLPPVVNEGAVPATLSATAGSGAFAVDVSDWFSDPEGDSLSFTAATDAPGVVSTVAEGDTVWLTPLRAGGAVLTVSAMDGHNPPVDASVYVLVYPAPHALAAGTYSFSEWSADAPAGAFPAHMIFLQSAVDDPDLGTDLPFAYHIPPADAAQPQDVDFPYAAESRSRINGLGADGISFINTGRGRDLGAALLALDTTGREDIRVTWTGGTVLPNERIYALRLQYRVGDTGPWEDLLRDDPDDGLVPVEYLRDETAGDSAVLGPVTLPAALEDQPLVQLQWRYHHVGVTSGPRAMLRMGDVLVESGDPATATALAFEPLGFLWAESGVAPGAVAVRAVNALGALDTTFSGTVTLSAEGTGALEGTTAAAAVGGIAVFDAFAVTGPDGPFVLRAEAAGLAAAESAPLQRSTLPVFLPAETGDWTEDANWTSAPYPDGAGAGARVPAGTEDRNVNLRAPVTAGTLLFDQGDSPHRNRLRDRAEDNALTFDGAGAEALLRVTGGGTGFVELANEAGTILATDLRLLVENLAGDGEYGALRLREDWSGPGGLIMDGHGKASLTGGGKDFSGAVTVEAGVLRVTESSAPAAVSAVNVLPGGQVRLVSTGPGRVYSFGGALSLAGFGRDPALIPEGEQRGILGALRMDPPENDSEAEVGAPVHLAGGAGAEVFVHTDGTRNVLTLTGPVSGAATLRKSGGGALVLAGDGTEAFPISVANGLLRVEGGFAASAVTLGPDGWVGGNGTVGALAGAGTVELLPGETLTAATATGLNHRLAADAVLRLTGADALGAPLNPANAVALFLGAESPPAALAGLLFSDAGADLAALVGGASWTVYAPDPEGGVEFAGQTHSPWTEAPLSFATVAGTLAAPEGPVEGTFLEVRFGAPVGYAAWRESEFTPEQAADPAVSGPEADPLEDGFANFLKYALGLGPFDRVTEDALDEGTSGDNRLFLRFRRDPAKTDIAYIVEASGDLEDWTEILYDSRTDPAPNNEGDRMRVDDTSPSGHGGKRFMRLRVDALPFPRQ